MSLMRLLVEFWVPVRPQGKERHTNSGRSTLRTRAYEGNVLKSIIQDAWGEKPPHNGFVYVERVEYYEDLDRKPDVDNVSKALYDAANQIIWEDDRQILCEYNSQKHTAIGRQESEGMFVRVFSV